MLKTCESQRKHLVMLIYPLGVDVICLLTVLLVLFYSGHLPENIIASRYAVTSC